MAKYRSYQLLLILSQVVVAQGPFSISTFAGGAQAAGPVSALEAAWASVEGIAFDGAGNLYVADAPDNRVWRVLRSGRVELLAGTGESGFSGDGGAATAARLNTPYGVAVDGAGNVFVADLGNGRVRRISASGAITTVAGGGATEPNFFGAPMQGRDAKLSSPRNLTFDGQGVLFFTDIGAHRVLRLSSDGTLVHVAGQKDPGDAFDNVPALLAPLRAPTALAFDRGGALYVADSGNKVIRRILRGTMTKVTSTGSAARVSFGTITGLAIDAGGEMYVAEGRETPLKKISPGGTVAQYPNGGRDVAVDGNGVLLADGGVVRRYSAAGAEVVAGSGGYYFAGDGGQAASARMRMPSALAVDKAGNLYIADTANHRVRRVTLDGKIETVAGPGQLNSPAGVAVDEGGMVWIADTGNNAIRRLLPNGTLETWTTGLKRPRGLAFDRAGVLVAADSENHRVVRLPAANRVEVLVGTGRAGNGGDGSVAAQAQLNTPTDVEYDRAGVLYICDGGNKRVRRVVGGIVQGYPSAGLVEPVGIALGAEGLYVTDAGTHRVAWLAANGDLRLRIAVREIDAMICRRGIHCLYRTVQGQHLYALGLSFDDRSQQRLALCQFLLQAFPHRNVAKNDCVVTHPRHRDLRNGRLDRKFLAAGANPHNHTQRAHLTRGNARPAEFPDMFRMHAAKALGDQAVQPPSQHVLRAPLEHVLRSLIEQDNLVPFIDRDDGIHGRLHNAFETQFVAMEFRLLLALPGHRPFHGSFGRSDIFHRPHTCRSCLRILRRCRRERLRRPPFGRTVLSQGIPAVCHQDCDGDHESDAKESIEPGGKRQHSRGRRDGPDQHQRGDQGHAIKGGAPGARRDERKWNRIKQPEGIFCRYREIQEQDCEGQQRRAAIFKKPGFLRQRVHGDGLPARR